MLPEDEKVFKQIEEGIDDFFTSDRFRNYLNVMSKFHHYSYINTILIYNQNPEATKVAGYNTWKKLGRHVERGERGIRIYRPYVKSYDKKTDKLDENGNNIVEKVSITRFTVAYVFDIAQTSGRDLPELIDKLEGAVNNFDIYMNALQKMSEYPIEYNDNIGKANGVCNYTDEKIYIKSGMSQAQTLKTAIHEVAHLLRHKNSEKSREEKEIEAESTAYVVCNNIGLDTSDYSFGYIGSWAQELDHEQRKNIIRGIHDTAHSIIEKFEEELAERFINDSTKGNIEESITKAANENLANDCDDINIHIVDVSPKEKRESININLINKSYNYEGWMSVDGLTKGQILSELRKYSNENPYDVIKKIGGECRELLAEPSQCSIVMNLENGNITDLQPQKVESLSAFVEYNSETLSENEVYHRLGYSTPNVSGIDINYNVSNLSQDKEMQLRKNKPRRDKGMDSSAPTVTIKFVELEQNKEVKLGMLEAVDFIRHMDISNKVDITVSYIFNGNEKIYQDTIQSGSANINFIDEMKVEPFIADALKTHANLDMILKSAERFAPDTTYGRKYAEKINAWVEDCRKELNSNSINCSFEKPPKLDDIYNLNERGFTER